MNAGESWQLSSYELRPVDIASVDADTLRAFSIGVRWPHRTDDWRMLVGTGRGVAALDAIDRVVGTAMWFPYSERFATVGMVITSPRLQALGAGRWLMDRVMAEAGPRALGLQATRAAYRLYLSLGFTPGPTVFQHNGEARHPGDAEEPADGDLRPVEPRDLAEIAALDAQPFGTRRSDLLERLLVVSEGTVLTRNDRIVAFALCRRFGRGHVIGPLVASRDADAITVARPHVLAHAGRFLRLDTRRKDGPFAAFLPRAGLPIYDTVTTMSLNQSWPPDAGAESGTPIAYALASQALG